MLQRPISTAADQVICAQDVMLLQYVYSDNFVWHGFGWSRLLAALLRKFRVIFGASISSLSLRHAMLALADTLNPSTNLNTNRGEAHTANFCKALMTKTRAQIDEGDLFAAFLLALDSCVRGEFSTFLIHLKGVAALLNELTKKASSEGYLIQLHMFWPLARDLLLESCRTFLRANMCVIWFFTTCRRLVGPQSLLCRIQYLGELNIADPRGDHAFVQTVWQYSVVLRNCFRKTLCRQLQGLENMEGEIESIVSELKSDLNSIEMTDIVKRLNFSIVYDGNPHLNSGDDMCIYALLIYEFCHLLITRLEAKTLIQGVESFEAELCACLILRLINTEWLNPDTSLESIFPRSLSRFFVPRILSITGLVLTRERFPQGVCAKEFLALISRSIRSLSSP